MARRGLGDLASTKDCLIASITLIVILVMRSPLVSVVVPVFNGVGFVVDAITSVVRQTYANLEIIVVDDGSTDDSASVVNAITDPRIRYVFQQNQGQSAAINYGVSISTGQFIKILDADDWINPTHIASQVEAIGDSTDVIASCRWGYFVNDFRSPAIRSELTNASYDDPMLWIVDSLTRDEGMMGGWMWLIPRQVWDRAGGYDSRLSLNNDFHFSIAILLASKGVRFAEGAIYSYRKGLPGALSATYGRKAMESALMTTQLGTQLLLARENSDRIRRIAADRFQSWLFKFYPKFFDLVESTESRIHELGGSSVQMQGGRLLKLIMPIIGWKGVRRLQELALLAGWGHIRSRKNLRRLARVDNSSVETVASDTNGSA
jgi:glycosyltransferase involved in cell wall biosynthesis